MYPVSFENVRIERGFWADRIRAIREEANRNNPMLRVEVDGGIKVNNVKTVLDAGADTIVAGSAVLGGDDAMEKARAFMEILA